MNNKGKLFLVATPIGNIEDISIRALKTLKEVDLIAAEDTRRSIKLLNYYDIKKRLTSYHEHNEKTKGKHLMELLTDGKNIAVISDAGCPGISDPGREIIKLCAENEIEVTMIPGPSALTTGIALSGMHVESFVFEGFLPTDKKDLAKRLALLKEEKRTMIFFEAPHRLLATLKKIFEVFGNREIVLARELTKKYEQIIRTTIERAINDFLEKEPRGEFVVIVQGAKEEKDSVKMNKNELKKLVKSYIDSGMDKKDALKKVAKSQNVRKNEIYKLLLEDKKAGESE